MRFKSDKQRKAVMAKIYAVKQKNKTLFYSKTPFKKIIKEDEKTFSIPYYNPYRPDKIPMRTYTPLNVKSEETTPSLFRRVNKKQERKQRLLLKRYKKYNKKEIEKKKKRLAFEQKYKKTHKKTNMVYAAVVLRGA